MTDCYRIATRLNSRLGKISNGVFEIGTSGLFGKCYTQSTTQRECCLFIASKIGWVFAACYCSYTVRGRTRYVFIVVFRLTVKRFCAHADNKCHFSLLSIPARKRYFFGRENRKCCGCVFCWTQWVSYVGSYTCCSTCGLRWKDVSNWISVGSLTLCLRTNNDSLHRDGCSG